MALQLASVEFPQKSAQLGRGSVPLRKNRTELIQLPQWERVVRTQPEISPVAYTLRDLSEGSPLVLARFERTAPLADEVQVRAIQPPDAAIPALPDAANVFGNIKSGVLRFGAGSGRETLLMETETSFAATRGVGAYTVVWQWQFRERSAPVWTDITRTRHRIYITLDDPTLPWTQRPVSAENAQLLWTEVLDVACAWARGARTKDEAAIRITAAVFSLGGVLLQYGCSIGTVEMYSSTLLNLFFCSAFLERLRGGFGNGPFVNCSDCASIVSTLANALGCSLWQSRMGEYFPFFRTNPILPIGTNQFSSPCGSDLGFSFHEVAWKADCDALDQVFDACLAADADPGLFPILPVIPANVRFGLPNQNLYRDWLAARGSREICKPRPEERRRRFVV
jgi:hypothetical protein